LGSAVKHFAETGYSKVALLQSLVRGWGDEVSIVTAEESELHHGIKTLLNSE